MDRNSPYHSQVRLLMRLFPIISREPCFALKGGTAINLFVRDMPRLSVDIDLVYLPIEDYEQSYTNCTLALKRIGDAVAQEIAGSRVTVSNAKNSLRLLIQANEVGIKVEISPVLRGCVFKSQLLTTQPGVEAEFGYAEMNLLAIEDLYGGKICAALDRQHPRDLFDIKLLLENEGLTNGIRRAFLVYLISHNRPMAELLAPNRKNIRGIFRREFEFMAMQAVTVDQLEEVREQLIYLIHSGLTDDEKRFLISFKSIAPDWAIFGLEGVDKLPAVRWKLENLEKMPRVKHAMAMDGLRKSLKMDE